MRRPPAFVLTAIVLVSTTLVASGDGRAGAAGVITQVGSLPSGDQNFCDTLTAVQTSSAPGKSSYVMTRAGILTTWRWAGSTGATGARARAVVFRPAGTGTWTVVARSASSTLRSSTTLAYPTRLKVRAGDVLGLTVELGASSAVGCWYSAGPGDAFSFTFAVAPAVGASFTPAQGTVPNARLAIAADLEPDADRDGYGDVTQDRCPTQATAGAACDRTAPVTSITAKPRSGRDRTAVIKFASNESRSTFRCSLDGAAYVACTSPRGASVRPGRHVFRVRATDRFGNVDRTPASAAWTVRT